MAAQEVSNNEKLLDAEKGSAILYSHFGIDDHHIYDQIQKVLVEVIKM